MKSLLILLTNLIVWSSLACDCKMKSIEEDIDETDFIITGQVSELLDKVEEGHYLQRFDSTRSYQVKMSILNSYKGGLKEGQIITIGSDFSNCSFYFISGGKYLLFLTKDQKSDKYYQRKCSYSNQIENASSAIELVERRTKYSKQK